jgi:hypothetical protein
MSTIQPVNRPFESHTVRLRPTSAAPRISRKLVRDMCDHSPLPAALVDDAALIVGELVTTSIKQAHTVVDVVISVGDGGVTVRVQDSAAELPMPSRCQQPSTARSLDIVQRLSSSWGHYCAESRREFWALLRAPVPAVPADASELARHVRMSTPARPARTAVPQPH